MPTIALPLLPLLRQLRLLAAILLAVVATGCASFTPSVREPLRIGTTDDLSSEALGFRASVSTLDQARETLRARGLTGIAEDAFVSPSGPVIAVLGADYQSRVHVFRDGRYQESVVLPTNGALPYGLVLRLGADEVSTMLLVLYRDPLGRREQPPELLSYRWTTRASAVAAADDDDPYAEPARVPTTATTPTTPTTERFELASRSSLASIVTRHRGMTNPIIVGSTFTEGALLFARDDSGRIWDKGYLVQSKAGAVALQAMPWATAMKCSCVQKYSLQ